MSEAVSALMGVAYDGIASVRELGLQGMITLRGDLASPKIKNATTAVAGVDMPGQRGINTVMAEGEENAIAWMSPDELLILLPYLAVPSALAVIEKALGDAHALAVDVSDARAMFEVKGAAAREVLAKLAPVDLSPEAFQPGEIRRTRLAQVPAAFWMEDDQTFRVVAFRSVAGYVFDILKAAAAPGSKVGYFC